MIKYPYLLPCSIAAAIISAGAVLSLFLGWDGGPREGAIRLSGKDGDPLHGRTPLPDSTARAVNALRKKVKKQLAGYFSGQSHIAFKPSNHPSPQSAAHALADVSPSSAQSTIPSGSAYGYGYGYRDRLGHPSGRVTRRRRTNDGEGLAGGYVGHFEGDDLNFAQRLLMGMFLFSQRTGSPNNVFPCTSANEFGATSLTSLWVQSAMNMDNEDLSDSNAIPLRRQEPMGAPILPTHRPGASTTSRPALPQRSSSSSSRLPTIYSNTGLATPPPLERSFMTPPLGAGEANVFSVSLAPISEAQVPSIEQSAAPPISQPTGIRQLPLVIIFHYFILALHGTTHDQVFLSYLNS